MMSNIYNTASSLASMDYKINYDQRTTIAEHLSESQSELSFLKMKLTQSYKKLEQEIVANASLEDERQNYLIKIQQLQSIIDLERRENTKLKYTLSTVLKNRDMLQEEMDSLYRKKTNITQHHLQQKEEQCHQTIQVLKRQYNEKIEHLKANQASYQQKVVQLLHKQTQMMTKIEVLQKEINKLTDEKVVEVKRLKHEIQCYQRNCNQLNLPKTEFQTRFTKRTIQAKDTNNDSNQNFNKSCQMKQVDVMNEKVGKWKRNTDSTKTAGDNELTDDEKLTKCQLKRKKLEMELNRLEKIKRLTPSDRSKIQMLEKSIYEIDSEISGLKRKIRNQY